MLTSTSNDVIEVTNSDVDVRANDVEIPTFRSTFRSTIRPSLTSTNASLSFVFQSRLWLDKLEPGQDKHLVDTDKLNGVNDL